MGLASYVFTLFVRPGQMTRSSANRQPGRAILQQELQAFAQAILRKAMAGLCRGIAAGQGAVQLRLAGSTIPLHSPRPMRLAPARSQKAFSVNSSPSARKLRVSPLGNVIGCLPPCDCSIRDPA